jgi:hypothetical protein
MNRRNAVIAAVAALAATAVAVSGTAAGAPSSGDPNRTLAQAIANGWDCNPLILIGGHFSPEASSGTDVASVEHQVFLPDRSFAGTEMLIRADLYAGQLCPTDQ